MNKEQIIELYRSMGWDIREQQMTPEEMKKFAFFLEVDTSTGKVCCDSCNEDYTDNTESGGIVMGTWGICPKCTPRYLEAAKKFNAEHAIKYRCPEGMAFADWGRNILRKLPPDKGLTTTIIIPSKE